MPKPAPKAAAAPKSEIQLAYERRLAEIDASKKLLAKFKKLAPATLAQEKQLGLLMPLCEDADREVRALAVTVIGRLPPEELSALMLPATGHATVWL